jgi:hypothetical protein
MNNVQVQIAAAAAERGRIEAQAWARAGLVVPYPNDGEQLRLYLVHLEGVMDPDQRRCWRAVCVTIEELEKYLP